MSGPIELSIADELRIVQAVERLRYEFRGVVNVETIQRLYRESLEQRREIATITEWLPQLTERYTRDRLRAIARLQAIEAGTVTAPAVLFLCTHNAGRSQMAAGWLRSLAGPQVEVFTAGSEPAQELNKGAVEAMAEVGIDITSDAPKPWADEVVRAVDVVVTMGCGDACPIYPGKRYIDWDVEDPTGKRTDEIRPIRNELGRRVRELMWELELKPLYPVGLADAG